MMCCLKGNVCFDDELETVSLELSGDRKCKQLMNLLDKF